MQHIKIFGSQTNSKLVQLVAQKLQPHFGDVLGDITVKRFSDGEVSVEINENVRGRDVFIIQSTCLPVNDTLMELMIMADALRRSSAASITAVVPYFGYARQDRRVRSRRVPISAKVVADMLTCVDINRIITVDLHAEQIQGFFSMPVDNIYASPAMLNDIKQHYQQDDICVVSPDVGGVVRARAIAKRLNGTELAIIDKRRPKINEAKVMNIIGDVSHKNCIIIDDIVDTANTLCQAAEALKQRQAKHVVAYCSHPVLSGHAIETINASSLDELVVTDTIPLSEAAKACKKIRQISLGDLIAETISRIVRNGSVSSLFEDIRHSDD